MYKHNLKTSVGIFLILSHFAVLIVVMVISAKGGIDFEETTTSVTLIAPMFAAYTTAIIKFIIDNQNSQVVKSPPVNKAYIFISFFIPALFVSAITAIVILRGYRIWIRNTEMYKYLLGAAETLFGVYVGMILKDMFATNKEPQAVPAAALHGAAAAARGE